MAQDFGLPIMYGAFDAKAADFDGDGDLDLAAIAFYPDYGSDKWESFAYLENRGGFDFVPYTNETVMGGRWLTMDVGDIDGDRDPDVVLGERIFQSACRRTWPCLSD